MKKIAEIEESSNPYDWYQDGIISELTADAIYHFFVDGSDKDNLFYGSNLYNQKVIEGRNKAEDFSVAVEKYLFEEENGIVHRLREGIVDQEDKDFLDTINFHIDDIYKSYTENINNESKTYRGSKMVTKTKADSDELRSAYHDLKEANTELQAWLSDGYDDKDPAIQEIKRDIEVIEMTISELESEEADSYEGSAKKKSDSRGVDMSKIVSKARVISKSSKDWSKEDWSKSYAKLDLYDATDILKQIGEGKFTIGEEELPSDLSDVNKAFNAATYAFKREDKYDEKSELVQNAWKWIGEQNRRIQNREPKPAKASIKSKAEYQGWSNYETWLIALWIDNEQSDQEYWRDRAIELHAEDPENCSYALADELKDQFEEANPLADAASFWTDLILAALAEVNWDEVAKSICEENEITTTRTESSLEVKSSKTTEPVKFVFESDGTTSDSEIKKAIKEIDPCINSVKITSNSCFVTFTCDPSDKLEDKIIDTLLNFGDASIG